ncbi:substrate-binding domain-containing protein [Tessaracoccus flavus]|uniref:Periplasmic binding protein domain-containing protein n=1 Tax=Tessaracoccus flavus TaxID=1610493 RepID=A0A1Q2CHJ5_9ACTN|nr:substrate-binding domain-containing protein [Tessaracoccus flavus]AQP45582.1 hypothetical protein RPIT_12840 [Tessaracoccus flavus]SDY78259.1 simple sugar transport system substrate-binding protein [Tessaracoccus flavus]
MLTKFLRLFIAALASMLVLTACGEGDTASPGDTPASETTMAEAPTETTEPADPADPTTTPADDESTPAAGGEPLTIGLVMLQGDDYFRNVQLGMEEAVSADGGTVIPFNSNNDPGNEAQGVQNLITRAVDGITMQPVAADASVATARLVKDAGIPLICTGNCTGAFLTPELVDGAAQSDNTGLGTATGEAAAEYIEANLGGTATVGILNCDSAAETCKLRKAGFIKALEDAGIDFTIAADQEGYLADRATPVATNMLSSNPAINVVWGSNEGGTVALVTAVKQAGADVAVFGTDISEQIAGFVKEGSLEATTGQDPAGTSAKAYEMVKKAINGETNEPFEALIPGITYRTDDQTTVDEYLANR